MSLDLGRALHTLTARLDRAADRMLQAEFHVSYRRFLVLYMVGALGASNQRSLADWLGVTEPSVSRMTASLAGDGLLNAAPHSAGGNQRQLTLTPAGWDLVHRCGALLVARLAALVEASGVPYDVYTRHTNQLVAALDAGDKMAVSRARQEAHEEH
jgi:DNA-binding MarR family transcriptional regulator